MSDPYTDHELAMDKWTPNRIARAMGASRLLKKTGPIVSTVNSPVPKFNSPKSISDNTIKRKKKLWEKQEGICPFCDKPMDTDEDPPTLDHIRPKSKGGTNGIKNMVLVHHSCNQMKGDMYDYKESKEAIYQFLKFIDKLHEKGYLK